MAAAILAFSGKYASCLVCLRLPALRVLNLNLNLYLNLNLNLNLSLNLPQFAEWQHIQVKPHVNLGGVAALRPQNRKTETPKKLQQGRISVFFGRIMNLNIYNFEALHSK